MELLQCFTYIFFSMVCFVISEEMLSYFTQIYLRVSNILNTSITPKILKYQDHVNNLYINLLQKEWVFYHASVIFNNIALYASLKSLWAMELLQCFTYIFLSTVCFLIFEEMFSCFTQIYLGVSKGLRNSLLLHLDYFERKKNYAHDLHLYLFELIKSNT